MKDRFPYIDRSSGGSIEGWLKAVSQALTVVDDETVIMPGHGDLANKKDYRNIRDAVMQIRDDIKRNIKTGKKLDEIIALKIGKEHDSTFGSGFIKTETLVKTIFNELTGKKDLGFQF